MNKRLIQYDLMRIVACLSVVLLHCAAMFMYDREVDTNVWLIANSFDAVSRFGVPVFVMISGALFLKPEREISTLRLWKHNILRLVILYVVWSCLYGLWDSREFGFGWVDPKEILREMMFGRYHLWFLPMLAGIYMLVPILRVWVAHADKKNVEYFLTLFFVLQILRTTLLAVSVGREEITYVLETFEPYMISGYLGYFILGYYLDIYGVPKKWHSRIYVMAVAGLVMNVVVSNYFSLRFHELRGEIYDSFSVTTFFVSLAVFLLCTNHFGKCTFSERAQKVILEFSAATFGIYAVHVGVLEVFVDWAGPILEDYIYVAIPLMLIGCTVVCYLMIALIRRIPVIGRYLA